MEAWQNRVRVLWLFRGPLLLLLVCTIFAIGWFATDLLPKLLPPTYVPAVPPAFRSQGFGATER